MGLVRNAVGATALGAAALAGAVAAGNLYLDNWEGASPEAYAEGSFCRLANGWRVHFTSRGEGDTVLLLHGFMDSVGSWRRNVEALAAGHRVLALDALGFGCSERVVAPVYSLKRQARVVKEFLDLQGIARVSLIGHSLGGALAAQFTYDFPERVHKLVLVAAAVYMQIPEVPPLLRLVPRSVPRGLMGLYAMLPHAVELGLATAYGDARRIDRDSIDFRGRPFRIRGAVDALLAMIGSPRETDLPAAVTEIKQPTLVIWGERDHLVPPVYARRLRREMPNARLAIIGAAGHMPHEEYPQQVNELLTRFLESGFEGLERVDA